MKKSLVIGILGLAVGAVSSYGQGAIFLDNYLSGTYNGIFQAVTLGGGLVPVGWTAGLYYNPAANQDIRGSIAADPTGTADPGSLNPLLVLATGPGSTAPFNPAGYFSSGDSFTIQPLAGTVAVPQNSYSLMLVAYNGASYSNSMIRGHSAAVYIQDAAPSVPNGADLGTFFPAGVPMFSVSEVPEPTTMALAGLGGLSLLLFRRKKA